MQRSLSFGWNLDQVIFRVSYVLIWVLLNTAWDESCTQETCVGVISAVGRVKQGRQRSQWSTLSRWQLCAARARSRLNPLRDRAEHISEPFLRGGRLGELSINSSIFGWGLLLGPWALPRPPDPRQLPGKEPCQNCWGNGHPRQRCQHGRASPAAAAAETQTQGATGTQQPQSVATPSESMTFVL